MQAIRISHPGDESVLQMADLPEPEPQPHEILVRVHAAGVNRSDLLQRKGGYGADPTGAIPGLEIAGEVVRVGAEVSRWQAGDRVCALLNGGGYAEFAVVDARHVLPMPDALAFTNAAALPETVLTVWSTVFQWAKLQPGENLLVHGGTSGIGVTAIQLGTAFGARVYTTAGSVEKCAFAEKLGAAQCVFYKETDFENAFADIAMNVVLDMVGGDYTAKNLRLMAQDGRLMFVNSMSGPRSEIDIPTLMKKRLTIAGSMLKPRDPAYKAQLVAEVEREVWPLLDDGRLRPIIHQILPLSEAAAAHRLMQESSHIGKIILAIS